MGAERSFTVVGDNSMPSYPISAEERLDSHFFIQWNLKRWRKSEFRQLAEPDVGWYGFQLFCEAHDETPVGTLPTNERLLAKALGITLERWQQLCERDITPLHGWYKVRCDNGEVRYAHNVVTEVAEEALKSKRRNAADAENRKVAKQLKDLEAMIKERIGAGQLMNNPMFLDRFNAFLEEHYPGKQRREALVRQALNEFMEAQG
ncbi:hypothetical protein [Thioclava sp. GXIMD2076]|uniref:DUF1376 domain-containing protein n=1 Tax=Thioclava kandeliae TaxID=3070818 RepID=A0ABV1SLP6_9RHOB